MSSATSAGIGLSGTGGMTCEIRKRRSGSRNGKLRRIVASTTVYIAVFTLTPTATVRIAIAAKPGCLRRELPACRKVCHVVLMNSIPSMSVSSGVSAKAKLSVLAQRHASRNTCLLRLRAPSRRRDGQSAPFRLWAMAGRNGGSNRFQPCRQVTPSPRIRTRWRSRHVAGICVK